MKDLTKNNVHLSKKSGYDKYFITVGNTRVESADLSSLDSDAKTSDIKRLFKKSMSGRLNQESYSIISLRRSHNREFY